MHRKFKHFAPAGQSPSKKHALMEQHRSSVGQATASGTQCVA
jgi:hypothetical protein